MTKIFYAICLCILIIEGISNKRQISRYEDYESKCEALLDSIASWDDSFLDTVCETDVYSEYSEAKEKLR